MGDRWPREHDALVFRSESGTPMNPRNMNRRLKGWLEKAGINKHLHAYDLRATVASIAAAAGVPVVTSTAPAILEAVGDAALKAPPDDPRLLAVAIHKVLTNTFLRASLVERGRERVAAEKCVMFVCARNKDADRRGEPLLAAINKLAEAERRTMYSTLGRVGGPAVLKILEAAIAGSDAKLHEIGLRALCNWPDASIAARLLELAAADEHPAHRIAALRAVIRVAPLRDKRSNAERLKLLEKAMNMATRDKERNLVLDRARAIRTLDTLRFITPYMDQAPYAR